MDIRFQAGGADRWKADVAFVPLAEGENILESCRAIDTAAPYLQIAPAMRDVSGRKGEIALVYGHPDLPFPRVMFLGLGDDITSLGVLREAMARGIERARQMRLSSVQIPVCALKRFGCLERVLEECAYACLLGGYEDTRFRHQREGEPAQLSWLAFCFDGDFVPDTAREAIRRGETAARGVLLARELINTPANLMYPASFAERAQELSRELPLTCTVLDEQVLAREGFNAHLAVGQGGKNAPRLVVLEYTPAGHENDAPLVYVGKGITFDSGGISLKPAAGMHTMKCDMTGAAAVLSALVSLASETVPHRLVGIMPLAENMPDGGAVHPGDVVTGLSGDSIEIVNTDAEGRLVLCDALTYAQKQWKPSAVVDVATLTGACATALGDQVAGLFSNSADLAERILSAGNCAGEAYWQLPLWQGYVDKLKSPIADICHTGESRQGGAITAALFLEHFIHKETLWAHLDIAGEDWAEKDTPLCRKGATGFAARTLIELGRGGFDA